MVNPEVHHFIFAIEAEVDLLVGCKVIERLHYVLDEVYHVCFHEMKLHLSVIDLSHIEKLVHQTEYSQAVAVHEVVQVLLLRFCLIFTHLLERTHHKGQRSADLVRDVREHLQFHLFDFRLFLMCLQCKPPVSELQRCQDYYESYGSIYYPRPE